MTDLRGTTGLIVRECEVAGRRVDVRIRDGVVVETGADLRGDGERDLDALGGALIPGLHDHHVHLFALAADLTSVRCGPPDVTTRDALAAALRAAETGRVVRGTGYHESVAGFLDRDALDAMVASRPVRVQHRSGAAWFLNSAALVATGLDGSEDAAVERDDTGRATGRVWRGDHLLRRAGEPLPDLRPVGRLLARRGVARVTDATPDLDERQVVALHVAVDSGALPQRMLMLGAPLDAAAARGVPWKIVLDESAGLDVDGLTDRITASHHAGRPVAVHCVTAAEAVATVTALRAAGALAGDRIEHGSVLPRGLDADLARLGVTVVTQPNFVAERGDDYLAGVDDVDIADLYRCRSLLEAGVAVAAGTDAPYGVADPWAAVAAAVDRRTRRGATAGPGERVSPERALALFLGDGLAPGGPARRVETGAVADLCLLRVGRSDALADPSADLVAATIVAGTVVHPD